MYVEKSTDGPTGMAKLVHIKGRFLLADMVRDRIGAVPEPQEEEIPR